MNSLKPLLTDTQELYTRTPGFRAYVETIRLFLRNHPDTLEQVISPEEAYKYRGNFSMMLTDRGIPMENHYIIMRVNDLLSTHDLDEKFNLLRIPSVQLTSRLKEIYRQSN